MIVASPLEDWITDPGRYRASEARINKFAARWNQGPFNRQIASVLAAVSTNSAEGVCEAVCRLFGDDSWVGSLIDALTVAMRDDPFFVPPFRHINSDVHQGLIVYEDEWVSIAAGISGVADLAAKKNGPRGATSIGFSGQVGVLKFVKSGQARLSFWEAPPIADDFSQSEAGRCRRIEDRDVVDGEILVVDGRYQSFVIEQARSNILLLQAAVKPERAPLSVEYDSITHGFVSCSAADDSASRIQMITTLLRKLDCSSAFPTVATFLEHSNFFVRWHVMRELLGLDTEAALPHLQLMAQRDPHPENRRAAAKVLSTLEPGLTSYRSAA